MVIVKKGNGGIGIGYVFIYRINNIYGQFTFADVLLILILIFDIDIDIDVGYLILILIYWIYWGCCYVVIIATRSFLFPVVLLVHQLEFGRRIYHLFSANTGHPLRGIESIILI